jgi:hypothetical protein
LSVTPAVAPLEQGRHQGSTLRRQVRIVALAAVVVCIILPNLGTWRHVRTDAETIAACLVLAGAIEVAFVRRIGFLINPDTLVLSYAWGWRKIEWSSIHGFEWARYMRSTTRALYAITDSGRVRIPSMSYLSKRTRWTGSYEVPMPHDLAYKAAALNATADERREIS